MEAHPGRVGDKVATLALDEPNLPPDTRALQLTSATDLLDADADHLPRGVLLRLAVSNNDILFRVCITRWCGGYLSILGSPTETV